MSKKTAIEINDMLDHVADWAVENNAVDAAIQLLERKTLEGLLESEGGNQCKVARRLGIHRNTMSRRLKVYGIDPRDPRSTTAKHGNRRRVA